MYNSAILCNVLITREFRRVEITQDYAYQNILFLLFCSEERLESFTFSYCANLYDI